MKYTVLLFYPEGNRFFANPKLFCAHVDTPETEEGWQKGDAGRAVQLAQEEACQYTGHKIPAEDFEHAATFYGYCVEPF